MSIAPTAAQETWKPVLQRVVAPRPSVLGMVPPGLAVDEAAAVASVLAAIPVLMVTVASKVNLAVEARDTELPALPGGGSRGSPLPSEPKAPGEDVAGSGSGRLAAAQANEVVEILSDDKADVSAKPSVPLRQPAGDVMAEPLVSSWGVAVVQSVAGTSSGPVVSPRDLAVARLEAGPSNKVPEGDLEWRCPEHPTNMWFIIRDSRERQL